MAMAASVAAAVWAPVVTAQGRVQRLASAYSDAVFHTRNLQAFASEVSANTGIRLEVHSNGSLHPAGSILAAVRSGDVAFGEVLMSAHAGQIPLLGVDALPFLVRGLEDARVLWQVSRERLSTQLREQGVRLLFAVPWPAQGLYARTPVEQLSDLRGRRFRVYNEVTRRMAELSGATPVTIPASDLVQSLASGQVDAMITSSVTGVDSKAWSTMKIFLDLRAWIPKNMLCASEKWWSSLSEDVRARILAAAVQAESRGWEMSLATDATAKQQLAKNGITLALPSPQLKRSLDLMGERSSREWAASVGVDGAMTLLDFYNTRS